MGNMGNTKLGFGKFPIHKENKKTNLNISMVNYYLLEDNI